MMRVVLTDGREGVNAGSLFFNYGILLENKW